MRRAEIGFLAAIVLGSGPVFGRTTDAFEFLTYPLGPRTAAMGGAGVADAPGVESGALNPAGLGRLWRDEVALSGARWLDDAATQSAGYAHPFFNGGALSVSVLTSDYGDIPSYTTSGSAQGNTQATNTAARVGYGRAFFKRVCAGVQGSYSRETLSGETANAIGLDGGVLWVPARSGLFREWTVGASVRNAGKGPTRNGESEDLPRLVQGGVTFRPFFEGASLSVDGRWRTDQSPVLLIGAEYWARGAVAFRAGYNGRESEEGSGVTLGFGFRAWDLQVDYAYVGAGDLGETHHMGLTFRFGSLAEKHYARGLENLQREDYAQAVVSFAEAIRLDPRHRRALEKLRTANTKLQQENPRVP